MDFKCFINFRCDRRFGSSCGRSELDILEYLGNLDFAIYLWLSFSATKEL